MENKHEKEEENLGNKKQEKLDAWNEKKEKIEESLRSFENQEINGDKIFPDNLLKLFEFCST